ncbi:MAG: hypothetical protein ACO3NK_14400 [Prochlorotrichaceae cyanobacterium]|jgi:hypothetical protein
MTGFIRGLFGGGKKNQQSSGAFYLEPDDAKTLGDIDYMRQSKVIRRTYAKKAGETEEKEVSTQVSALSKSEVAETRGITPASSTGSFSTPASSSFGTASSSFGTASSSSETRRRNTGNDMDMFRKMAKDVKKR